MYFVGGVEIAAGLIVAVAPVIGAPLVAAWLAGIVINLLTNNPPEYYDIALRDFGLRRRAGRPLARDACKLGRRRRRSLTRHIRAALARRRRSLRFRCLADDTGNQAADLQDTTRVHRITPVRRVGPPVPRPTGSRLTPVG
jgi:hypothetical protein